jgi:hypothetical protein
MNIEGLQLVGIQVPSRPYVTDEETRNWYKQGAIMLFVDVIGKTFDPENWVMQQMQRWLCRYWRSICEATDKHFPQLELVVYANQPTVISILTEGEARAALTFGDPIIRHTHNH